MPKAPITEISGVIRAMGKKPEYSEDTLVEFTVIDESTRLIPVRFRYPSRELAQTVYRSLRKGLSVRFSISGKLDDDSSFYFGAGLIRVAPATPSAEAAEFFGVATPPESDRNKKFNRDESHALLAAIEEAKFAIRDAFSPTENEMASVEQRLDDLAAKVGRISKFDWKRLFVTCVVGVSVDLGFGATVPELLVNLFKNLFSGIFEQRLLRMSEQLAKEE